MNDNKSNGNLFLGFTQEEMKAYRCGFQGLAYSGPHEHMYKLGITEGQLLKMSRLFKDSKKENNSK